MNDPKIRNGLSSRELAALGAMVLTGPLFAAAEKGRRAAAIEETQQNRHSSPRRMNS